MQVQPINQKQSALSFKADLWVCNTVKDVIKSNEKAFVKAAEHCDQWLRNSKGYIAGTMTIRKNTALNPKVAFREFEYRTTYAYPHEESGHTDRYLVDRHENLEFEFGNRKCGFWFNPKSNEFKLLEDFKNVFNYLTNK